MRENRMFIVHQADMIHVALLRNLHHCLLDIVYEVHVVYISGAKFREHCFYISGDILDSVFYCSSGTIYDVITILICIIAVEP